jgi:hypothetical protein
MCRVPGPLALVLLAASAIVAAACLLSWRLTHAPPSPASTIAESPKPIETVPRDAHEAEDIRVEGFTLRVQRVEVLSDGASRIEIELLLTLPTGKAAKIPESVLQPMVAMDTGETLRGAAGCGEMRTYGPGPSALTTTVSVKAVLPWPEPNPRAAEIRSLSGKIPVWIAEDTKVAEFSVPGNPEEALLPDKRWSVCLLEFEYGRDKVVAAWEIDKEALTNPPWYDVTLLDANGLALLKHGPISVHGYSWDRNARREYVTFALDGRRPARLIVSYVTRERETTLPFEFKNVTLPREGADAKAPAF